MHSKGSLSNIEKLDYFVSWFNEFSEMEKGDFIEIIGKKFNDKVETGNGNLTYGFDKLEINENLPSIFKIRIELFEQWFEIWTEDEKDQLLKRIKNLDSDFSEKLNKVIETGKLPSNNLTNPTSYEISDSMYEELRRKNHEITNGNSLNSIDLLNTSNDIVENGLVNGSTNVHQNGHSNGHSNGYQNGHSSENSNHNSSLEEEEEEINNEDSTNQISSLETDNAHNGASSFNESIEFENTNDNL